MGRPMAMQVVQETMVMPLLVKEGFVLSPHPRLTHEKTGLTSGVSADVMSRVQTVTTLVIRCSRVRKRQYQATTGV